MRKRYGRFQRVHCSYKKYLPGSPGGSQASLIPINTPNFVRLHPESVGGTTIYLEGLISREGTSSVIRSFGIAAMVAFTKAIADNRDQFF